MIALIVIATIVSYSAVGAWVWGYWCAHLANQYNIEHDNPHNASWAREPKWYYDTPMPVGAAVFWPVYMLFHLLLGKFFVWLATLGEKRAVKGQKAKRLRIELEKKIRIEQERIEREVEKEIESIEESMQQAAVPVRKRAVR